MISPKIAKKKLSNSTSTADKKMKIIQKKKAERIKEKLSGKNYSPIVAKAKTNKGTAKKNVPTPSASPPPKKSSKKKREIEKTKITEKNNKSQTLSNELTEKILPVVESKTEKNAEKKLNKRKLEDIVNTSNKKTKINSITSDTANKIKPEDSPPLRTSSRKKKVNSQKLESVKIDTEVPVKAKNKKVLKTVTGVKEGENSSSPEELKITKNKKESLKSVKATKSEVDNINGPEGKSISEKKTPRKKVVNKRKSGISKLKPISNIKSLQKKPSPSVLKAKALKRKAEGKQPERGVCYFSHIPHGFYEKELTAYCSQFGKVTGVYHPVSRDGNSRGYAFVEFRDKEVAEVVADTMNNYLMFNRLVKCKYIPPEQQRPMVFKHKKNNFVRAEEKRNKAMKLRNRTLSPEEEEKWKKKKLNRINSLHKKLAALGVDYDFQVNNGTEEKKEVASPEK